MYFIDDPLSTYIGMNRNGRRTLGTLHALFVGAAARRRAGAAPPEQIRTAGCGSMTPTHRLACAMPTPKTPSVVDHATRSQYFLGAQLHLSAHERKDVSASLEGKIERLLHGGERHLRFQLHEADALGARQKADG